MSWNDYLNQLQTKRVPDGEISNCVEKAAIISLSDISIWACTEEFGLYGYDVEVPTEDGAGMQPIHVDEVDLLQHIVNHNGSCNSLAGIRISNEKYFKVSSDESQGLIYLKKNGGGACIAKCDACIIFASWNSSQSTTGSHPQSQSPGLCNEQVEKLADYLKRCGY